MIREPFIAHSELTNEIYIVVGKEKYRVTEQAIKAVMAIKALKEKDILDKVRAEIKGKIEQEEFARSIFRHEEKDTFKAEQCTGSIMAYNNVIKLIDKYKAGSEDVK